MKDAESRGAVEQRCLEYGCEWQTYNERVYFSTFLVSPGLKVTFRGCLHAASAAHVVPPRICNFLSHLLSLSLSLTLLSYRLARFRNEDESGTQDSFSRTSQRHKISPNTAEWGPR